MKIEFTRDELELLYFNLETLVEANPGDEEVAALDAKINSALVEAKEADLHDAMYEAILSLAYMDDWPDDTPPILKRVMPGWVRAAADDVQRHVGKATMTGMSMLRLAPWQGARHMIRRLRCLYEGHVRVLVNRALYDGSFVRIRSRCVRCGS